MFQIGNRVKVKPTLEDPNPVDIVGTITEIGLPGCLVQWFVHPCVLALWYDPSRIYLVGDIFYDDFRDRIEDRLE